MNISCLKTNSDADESLNYSQMSIEKNIIIRTNLSKATLGNTSVNRSKSEVQEHLFNSMENIHLAYGGGVKDN